MEAALVIKAVGALGVLGLVASGVLAIASRRFWVEVDPRVEQILSLLPGSNCGACGNPSCFATAELIAQGEAAPSACIAGGQETADAIADLVGAERCEVAALVVARACGGGTQAQRAFEYRGVPSCTAASRLAGGPLACQWGCLGYGDCVRACPFGALRLDDRGLPVVDLARCTGCGVCVQTCPRGGTKLLWLVPEGSYVVVRCSAHSKPKDRKAACARCCIACKKCERVCPSDAIHVVDGVAVVAYGSCTACGACVDACPQQCIDLYGRGRGVDAMAADGAGPAVGPRSSSMPGTDEPAEAS
ncbi:MAG: RnfABCDGE type electron transport complex subunit B [Coriobacteriia bacterium]|nr:RnfABCDGE type electron transport complex subunit B [Coriobacteriia bacterium]